MNPMRRLLPLPVFYKSVLNACYTDLFLVPGEAKRGFWRLEVVLTDAIDLKGEESAPGLSGAESGSVWGVDASLMFPHESIIF